MTLTRYLRVGSNGARLLSNSLYTPSRSLMQQSLGRWSRPTTTTIIGGGPLTQKLGWTGYSKLPPSFHGSIKRALSASTSTAKSEAVKVTKPVVGYWLYFNAGLVFAIVVVGGLTRLTESGLSITEWNVISGMKPPRSALEWDEEFEKYKQFPEYKM